MWSEILKSETFWASAAQSYIWNIAFAIAINVAMDLGRATIPFLTDFTDDMAAAFAYQAFFCGLFTTPFSSYLIAQSVAAGAIRPPDADAIAKSWLGWLLRRGNCIRSLFLALISLLLFGLPTVGVGAFVCKHRSECQSRVWVFLAILAGIPLQIVVSLVNYASTAHLSRARYCPLNVALLKGSGETIQHALEGGAGCGELDSSLLPNVALEAVQCSSEEAVRLAENGSTPLPKVAIEAVECCPKGAPLPKNASEAAGYAELSGSPLLKVAGEVVRGTPAQRERRAALGRSLFRCAFQEL